MSTDGVVRDLSSQTFHANCVDLLVTVNGSSPDALDVQSSTVRTPSSTAVSLTNSSGGAGEVSVESAPIGGAGRDFHGISAVAGSTGHSLTTLAASQLQELHRDITVSSGQATTATTAACTEAQVGARENAKQERIISLAIYPDDIICFISIHQSTSAPKIGGTGKGS